MTLQNNTVKPIAGVPRRTNVDALYVKLNILPPKSCMFTMWDCWCVNMIMIYYLNWLMTCLLRFVKFIIMVHGNPQDIICLLIVMAQPVARNVLSIWDLIYGTSYLLNEHTLFPRFIQKYLPQYVDAMLCFRSNFSAISWLVMLLF